MSAAVSVVRTERPPAASPLPESAKPMRISFEPISRRMIGNLPAASIGLWTKNSSGFTAPCTTVSPSP